MTTRYTICCRGKYDGEGQKRKAICHGWGRYGTPGEKCPLCKNEVIVIGTFDAIKLEEGATWKLLVEK